MSLERHTRISPRSAHMKRGRLKAKPYRTADNAARTRMRRATLKKVGKKGRANARANKVIDAECARFEIDSCELGYEGCTRDYQLTRAHVAKRRELLPGELEHGAIKACRNCHDKLDFGMSHAEMRREVESVLAERPARYDERRFQAA